MPNPATTPLGLLLGDDTQVNENWLKLDKFIQTLAAGDAVFPGNVLIQGSLTANDASFAGPITAPAIQTGNLTVTGQATLNNLAVNGTLSGSLVIPPAMLGKGAGMTGAWVGTANTATQTVGATLAQLASVATDASEAPDRWTILIAQATLAVSFGSQPGNLTVTLELHRGPTLVYSRQLTYFSSAPVDGLDLDIPLTLVRLALPGDTAAAWSLWAKATTTKTSVATHEFSQLSALQVR